MLEIERDNRLIATDLNGMFSPNCSVIVETFLLTDIGGQHALKLLV